MSELDQYIFIIHVQIDEFVDFMQFLTCNNEIADKDTDKSMFYIDMKLKELHDILRKIM